MIKKSKRAQSIVELIAGIIVLIPIVFIVIDLSIIVMASFKNESICREACRAAASSDPKDCLTPAKAEVDKYNQPGGFATFALNGNPQTTNVELPSSGHGQVSGTVSLKTTATVHAPFIVGFFVPTCKLDSEQSFPITYNMP